MAENPFLKSSGGTKSTPKKKDEKKKGFFGIDLPKIFGKDLPKIGVTTDKKNPFTQVEEVVTGLPANLLRLGRDLGNEVLVKGVTSGFDGKSKKKGWAGVREDMPVTSAILESPVKTVKSLDPVNLGTHIAKGDFKNSRLGKRIQEEGYLGTGLATISDAAMLAGGAGLLLKAGGAGGLAKAANLERTAAASSKAAGLSRGAKAADLRDAATKNAAKMQLDDAMDLEKAAGQLDEAAKLRETNTGFLPKLAEGLQDVSRLGAQLGNTPAKPYALLGQGLKKIPEGVASGVEKAVDRGLPGSGRADRMLSGVSGVVKYAGDKAKIADLYYKHVTAPTQEALYRRLERGESVEAIRAGIMAKSPGSEAVFNKILDDVEARAAKINETRPRGIAEEFGENMRTAWSKTPEEWQADVDAGKAKVKQIQEEMKALPDGDPKLAGANKRLVAARKEAHDAEAMRKFSMEPQDAYMDSPAVAKAMTPEKAPDVPEDTIPEAGTPGGPSYEDTMRFNKENIRAVRAEFHDQIQQTFGNITAKQIIPQMDVPKGSKINLAEELKERGHTAWDPQTGRALKDTEIMPDSPVVPNQVFDEVERYGKYNQFDKANSQMLRAYDYATGKWKHTVLALSPRWHVGNILGNVAMAAAAGLGPIDIVKYGVQAKRMLKSGEAPAELLASGFHFSEEMMSSITQGPVKGAKQKLMHPIQASYQMNQFVDDMNRTMIYLAKKDSGVSSQAAINGALKAAGDFSRMTPMERNFIRRVVPFYAWQKHITKLTFRLPLEDPARVAWTLHLAEMGERLSPDEGAEGFGENTIGIAGKRINLSSLNPFASSYALGLGGEATTRLINPMAGTLIAAATGASTKRGFNPVQTPDTGFPPEAKPLVGSPDNLLQYIANLVPTTRQAQDMIAGETKARFDTGQERPAQYPDDAQGRPEQLLKFLGIDIKKDLKGQPSKKETKEKVGRKTTGQKSGNPFLK